MAGGASPLPLDYGGCGGTGAGEPARRLPRDAAVRLVDYAPFPRARRGERWRSGSTVALSPAGACLRADQPVPVGSLLRAIVRGLDGRPTLDLLARVAACSEQGRGAFRLELALLASRGCAAGSERVRDALGASEA